MTLDIKREPSFNIGQVLTLHAKTKLDNISQGVAACMRVCISSYIQLFQLIKVVPEQSGKVEYDRERLLGIAKKLINFFAIPSKPFALVFDFSALLGNNLN